MSKIDPLLRKRIEQVKRKRPRIVLEHILRHGSVTTQELKEKYGYDHPPRAAHDVKDEGIPLVSARVVGPSGRKIAAYRLGDPSDVEGSKTGGRHGLPKSVKRKLLGRYGAKCALCGGRFPPNALQMDQRIPYKLAGDIKRRWDQPKELMLVCGSCNAAKNKSCKACANWKKTGRPRICRTCFWASPHKYEHIAMEARRSVTLTWYGREIDDFEHLQSHARRQDMELPEFLKRELLRVPESGIEGHAGSKAFET